MMKSNDKEQSTTMAKPDDGDLEAPPPQVSIKEEEQVVIPSSSSCLICYEDFEEENEQSRTIVVQPCRHAFCRACLQQHVQHAVLELRQVPVPCPCRNSGQNTLSACQAFLTATLVESLLDDDNNHSNNETNPALARTWRIYQRLERLQADPSLISCPWCDALVACPQDKDDAKSSSLTSCPTCRQTFCTLHGSAHPGRSCAQYLMDATKTTTSDLVETERVLQQHTKPCSHCGGRIQKEAGCDHVVCPACRHDMCYKCGTHEHLTGKVIRTCSQCSLSYLDHRHEMAYKCRTLLSLPLLLPTFLLYVVLMAVLAVVTGGFGCCFGCGRCLANNNGDDDDVADAIYSTDDNNVEALPGKKDEEQQGQQQQQKSSWERAVRLGLSMVALPWIVTLRDLGVAEHVRLPHEIYHNLPAGGNHSSAREASVPEIPTMHVFGSDSSSSSSDIEAPSSSPSPTSSSTGGSSDEEEASSASQC